MNDILKNHVGFPDDAPAEVNWSKETFVRPVEPYEKRNLRPYVIGLLLAWIVITLLAVAIAVIKGKDNLLPNARNADIWHLLFALSVSLGLLTLFLQGHVQRFILMSMVGFRPNRLFQPDSKCLYVQIERAGTFDKMKLCAEDFGLLRAHSDTLQIEMMNHRAQFLAKDVSFSIHNVGKSSGVIITCDSGRWPWSVALVAPLQSWNILLGANHALAARWLLKRIQKGLATR
jgi:hypothetical protein